MYDIPEHWGATPFKRMWKSLLQRKWLIIFSLNLFHKKATLERELPRGGDLHEWS